MLVSTLFEMEVIIATKIRREKNENCVDFSFHSISGYLSYTPPTSNVRSDSTRDMGTEMTPIASQEPSRTGTPLIATTPSTRSPVNS